MLLILHIKENVLYKLLMVVTKFIVLFDRPAKRNFWNGVIKDLKQRMRRITLSVLSAMIVLVRGRGDFLWVLGPIRFNEG
jgi:hypothetical protein